MRFTRIATLALAAAALPVAVSAQAEFEGTIQYQMSMAGMSMDMTQHVKGKKIRQEMNMGMGAVVTIIDFESGTMAVLMPGQPVRTMSMDDVRAMAGQQANLDGEVDVTATGNKETVAGHECEHYIVKQDGQEADICAATGLGFVMASMGTTPGSGAWDKLQAQFKDGFLPLKMSVSTEQGQATLQAVSVQRKSLSDDLFKLDG